ncbi:hypothetical protein AKO1_010423, partial [Acrasis kona]
MWWIALLVALALLCAVLYYVVEMPYMLKDLDPKRRAVLVTGAASGIGKKTCERLLSDGAFVFACDINKDALEEVYKSFPASNVCCLKMDVTKMQDVRTAYEQIEKEIIKGNAENYIVGSLFGLVNCAGIAPPTKSSLVEKDDREAELLYAVNVLGIEKCNRVFYPLLSSTNNKQSSCIVNIASVCGLTGFPFFSHYSATKAAVSSYSASLRRELLRQGAVRVTCINPGFTDTPIINTSLSFDSSKFKKEMTVLQNEHLDLLWNKKRMQKPRVVADAIVDSLFSSNNSSEIRGLIDNRVIDTPSDIDILSDIEQII